MPQQSQRRPRVTDLQPWRTDAPLDKSADLPLGWLTCGAPIDFKGMQRKLPNETRGLSQLFKFSFEPLTSMASPRLSTRRFGVRKPAQV